MPARRKGSPQRNKGVGPRRTCVQCGAVREKAHLLRIAGRPGETWSPDPDFRSPGRGLYLCPEGDCVARFAARLRTPKGGARWKMGSSAKELSDRLLGWKRRGPES